MELTAKKSRHFTSKIIRKHWNVEEAPALHKVLIFKVEACYSWIIENSFIQITERFEKKSQYNNILLNLFRK